MEVEGFSGVLWSSFISSDEVGSADRSDGFMPLLYVGIGIFLVHVAIQRIPSGH